MSTKDFSLHFNQLQGNLQKFALSLTSGNAENAKDLIQETACRAYGNRDKYRIGTNFKAWVMTIMRNTFINNYRKKKYRKVQCEPTGSYVFEVGGADQTNSAESGLRMQEIVRTIKQVDDMYLKPFLMHHQGFQYDEIAAEMALPIGTVKSRIFQARRQMRTLLAKHCDIA